MEAARFVISSMLLVDGDSLSSTNTRLLMIFVGIVALAMLVQAIVVLVLGIIAAKASKRAMEIAEEVRLKSLPIIDTAHSVVHDLQPKMRIIADNFVETSHVVRSKAMEFDSTLTDVNSKTRTQVERVDEMVSSVLDTTAGIASAVQKGVQVPVREFSGLMSGLKAGIDVLVGRTKRSTNYSNGRKPADYDDGKIGY